MVKIIKKVIKFKEFLGYFWYSIPQEIYNRWEDNRKGKY